MVANIQWQYRNDEGKLATDRTAVPFGVTCYTCYSHNHSLLKIKSDLKGGLEHLMFMVDLFKDAISNDEHSKLMNLYVGCIADNPEEARNPKKAEERNMQHRPQCCAHNYMGLAYLVGLNEFRKLVRGTIQEQGVEGEVSVQVMADFDPEEDIWRFAAKYMGNSIDLVTYQIKSYKTEDKKNPIAIKRSEPLLFEGNEKNVEDKIKEFFD